MRCCGVARCGCEGRRRCRLVLPEWLALNARTVRIHRRLQSIHGYSLLLGCLLHLRHQHAHQQHVETFDSGQNHTTGQGTATSCLKARTSCKDTTGGRTRDNGVPGVFLFPEIYQRAIATREQHTPHCETACDKNIETGEYMNSLQHNLEPRAFPLLPPRIGTRALTRENACDIRCPGGALRAPPIECQIVPPTNPVPSHIGIHYEFKGYTSRLIFLPNMNAPPASSTKRHGHGSLSSRSIVLRGEIAHGYQ